jgi:hypothetical protein
MLRDGRLHLSGIALLARHLTPENRDRILGRAVGLPHRQLKELAAELEPRPDAVAMIRKLPARGVMARPANGGELRTYGVDSPVAKLSAEKAVGRARARADDGLRGLRRQGRPRESSLSFNP